MFHVLKGKKAGLTGLSLAPPASLGTHGEEAAVSIIVLCVFGNTLASVPSFRVHVSICWLQQYYLTWCMEEM